MVDLFECRRGRMHYTGIIFVAVAFSLLFCGKIGVQIAHFRHSTSGSLREHFNNAENLLYDGNILVNVEMWVIVFCASVRGHTPPNCRSGSKNICNFNLSAQFTFKHKNHVGKRKILFWASGRSMYRKR